MAANTITCTNGVVTGTDPAFVITKTSQNHSEGIYVYLDLAIGTAATLALTFDIGDESLGDTTLYRAVSVGSETIISALTYTMNAPGKYRIPISLGQNETVIAINATYGQAASDATCAVKIMEE